MSVWYVRGLIKCLGAAARSRDTSCRQEGDIFDSCEAGLRMACVNMEGLNEQSAHAADSKEV